MDDAIAHDPAPERPADRVGAPTWGTFELPPATVARSKERGAVPVRWLSEEILLGNVRWFCRLRWVAIAVLAAFGLFGLVPGAADAMGVRPRMVWPFTCAALLAVSNVIFLLHARRLRAGTSTSGAPANLWAQMVSDLVVVTVVVHFTGSVDTYVPFAYLFHIVLACIFVSSGQSLVVTLLACVLYAACVLLEQTLQLKAEGVFVLGREQSHLPPTGAVAMLNFVLLLTILTVVWYLASHLGAMVRQRDQVLATANRRLVEAQEERALHMRRTTHELKAPFAAIHAHTQLLRRGYCGALPEKAMEVIGRIAARCERLAGAIQEMLQLANLQSKQAPADTAVTIDLADVLQTCIAHVQPTAEQRGIAIEADLQPGPFRAVEEHMRMLLNNLVTNAVNYARDGGHVSLSVGPGPGGGPLVRVADDGIGIPADKLPHIFDEFYRTEEAVAHNRESTGLGLAIVKTIATAHGIGIRVRSQPGEGTTFELAFPRAA